MTPEELLNELDQAMNDNKKLEQVFIGIYKDLIAGVNLQQRLEDVEYLLSLADKSINENAEKNIPTPGLNKVRDELDKIKFEILEKL